MASFANSMSFSGVIGCLLRCENDRLLYEIPGENKKAPDIGSKINIALKAIETGATKVIAEYGNYDVETLIVPDTRKYLNNY